MYQFYQLNHLNESTIMRCHLMNLCATSYKTKTGNR